MGVGIETWRQRIGSFLQYGSISGRAVRLSGLACHSRVTPRLACILAVLLIIGGVELNPGPRGSAEPTSKIEDIVHRLDDLFTELRDARTSLSSKLDDTMREVRQLTTRLQQCETDIGSYRIRLDAMERAQATVTAQLAALQASSTATATSTTAPAVANDTSPPPIRLSDVVRELDMRASKKSNIVISGIRPSSTVTDTDLVKNLLCDELGITANVTRCARLGKPSADANRPCRLLVTLSSDTDSSAAIRSAKKLRSSTDVNVRDHVYINADQTPEQRKQDYDLRCELKRRRAAGEQNLVIRNGVVQTKSTHTTAAMQTSLPATPAATAGSATA